MKRVFCVFLVVILLQLTAVFTPIPLATAAPSTYLNETFGDHANNWLPVAGPWALENGRYSNCIPNSCDNQGVTRSYIAVASNTRGYTIETDVYMIGNAQEAKVIYTNANVDEAYRVDIMRSTNQIRLSAPSPSNVKIWTPDGTRHGPITGNATQYHLKVVVSRNSVSVYYRKGNEPLDQILTLNTSIYPDGKVGVGTFAGDCDFDNFTVTGEEGIGAGISRLIPVFGYERTEACNEGPENPYKGERITEKQCDRPLFSPWNRELPEWWKAMTEEMDHANIGIVAAHNRGCSTANSTEMHGNGDMCPNQLTKLVQAITSRGSGLKVAMFDDFPTVGDEYKQRTGNPFNVGASQLWQDYLWDRRWNRFYQTIPSNLLAKEGSRPLIFIWDPGANVTNMPGNLSRMLDWLRGKIQTTYGFNPFIVVSQKFYNADTTLNGHVDAVYTWFEASQRIGTLPAANYNGYTGATVAPSFRYAPNNTGPGCGSSCLEIPRRHGNELISNLEQQKSTKFVLLEGWTNVIESAGYYRNVERNDPNNNCTQPGDQNWMDYPNQSLNIVQRYSNPNNTYVELEAETADDYNDTSPGNTGGSYRVTNPGGSTCTYNKLDVGYDGSNYFVGWIEPNEQIGFRDVFLPAGNYSLSVRYSTPQSDAKVCARTASGPKICTSNLPPTGRWTAWNNYTIGTISLHRGLNSFVFDFPGGYLNVDKVIVRRL